MATKLYLHNALFDTDTYPGSYPDSTGDLQESGGFPGTPTPDYNQEDAVTVNRSMSKTKGSSSVNMEWSTNSTSLTQMNYITKFISDPLKDVTTINANQWKGNFAELISSGNVSYNSVHFIGGACYVWRPSTNALVGVIEDWAAFSNIAEPNATNVYKKMAVDWTNGTSNQVTGIQDDDVIVLSCYSRHQQSNSSSYTVGIQIDGTDEWDGSATNTTVSDFAAYIETPQDLTFVTDTPVGPSTMDVTDTVVLTNKFITKVV